jgi:hypothetical protein
MDLPNGNPKMRPLKVMCRNVDGGKNKATPRKMIIQVELGIEPRSAESESAVITITLLNR